MHTFESIIVATDFSECAAAALEDAVAIAAKFDARLLLVHSFMLLVPAYGSGLTFPVAELEGAAQASLDAQVAQARKTYPRIEGRLVIGDVTNELLRVAREEEADLIVMGTHGRRGVSRLFLGSVAERVVRTSRVPVLTVSARGARKATVTAPSATA